MTPEVCQNELSGRTFFMGSLTLQRFVGGAAWSLRWMVHKLLAVHIKCIILFILFVMFIHLRALKSSSPHVWHSVIYTWSAIVIHYIHFHTSKSPQQLVPLTYSVVYCLSGCAILTCTCLCSPFVSRSVLQHHVSYSPVQETLHIITYYPHSHHSQVSYHTHPFKSPR